MTLRDGRVLLVGGPTEGFYTAQIWDPNTGQWEIAGRPTTDIDPWGSRHDAVVLSDGRVLVTLTTIPPLGGVTHTEAEIYDPDSGVFRQISDPFLLDHPLPYLTLPVVMSDGRVLLATSLRGGVVFDPADESFTSVGERESYSETDLTAAALNDGRVLLVDPMGAAVYDPATDDVTSVKPVYPTNRGVALALLQDGRVLVTGGEEWSYEDARDLGSIHAQVFDPKTGRFAAVGSMVEPRSHHSAATLADGRVVVVGGAGDRVEVFDPETATFKRAPLLTRPRNNPSVVRLDDGNLLVVGGWGNFSRAPLIESFWVSDPTTPRTAEIYHPDHRSGKPSAESLSGFTLVLEVDFVQEAKRPGGDMSVLISVPPGGLEGVTSGYVVAHGATASGSGGSVGLPVWFYPDGVDPGPEFWGQPEQLRRFPPHCEQGCEIHEMLIETADLATHTLLGVQFHIQYEGRIPAQAGGITLTFVDE